jgi:hypothetical protein
MEWRRGRKWLRKMRKTLTRRSRKVGDGVVFEMEGKEALDGEWSHRRVI